MKVLTWPGCEGWRTRSSGTPAHTASTGTLPVPSPLPCCCSLQIQIHPSQSTHFCLTLTLFLHIVTAACRYRYTTVTSHPLLSDTIFAFVTAACKYIYTRHHHYTSDTVSAYCYCSQQIQIHHLHHPYTSVWHCFCFCYCSMQLQIQCLHHPYTSVWYYFCLSLLQPADTDTPPSPAIHFRLTLFLLLLLQPADTDTFLSPSTHFSLILFLSVVTAACRYRYITSQFFLGIRWTRKWDHFYLFTMHLEQSDTKWCHSQQSATRFVNNCTAFLLPSKMPTFGNKVIHELCGQSQQTFGMDEAQTAQNLRQLFEAASAALCRKYEWSIKT